MVWPALSTAICWLLITMSESAGSFVLPRQSAIFDERRNSSRVFPVPPDALPNAMRALAGLRRDYPELVSWIEEGAPRLTAEEHYARFGEDFARKPRRARENGEAA